MDRHGNQAAEDANHDQPYVTARTLLGDDVRSPAGAGTAIRPHDVPHSGERGSQACRHSGRADDDQQNAKQPPHRYRMVVRSSQIDVGFDWSTAASRVMPGRICPICIWLTVCCVVAGYGGMPSGITVRSNCTIRSKLIMPTWRIPVIVTLRRTLVPPAMPAAAEAAEFAAWVWAAIIWFMLAIRACASRIRSAAGGIDLSMSLACFCRSRMLLKTPMVSSPGAPSGRS